MDRRTQRKARPMTLTEFLLARIAEDEAAAEGDPHASYCEERGCTCGAGTTTTRVLAECEAKRRIILALCDDYEEPSPSVLRTLAGIYADHPDYDEAWRP